LEDRIANSISVVKTEMIGRQEIDEDVLSYSEKDKGTRYIVSVADEIVRLLTTPLGSRVMRPDYGSELYKVRDRELNGYWRLMAIAYTFIAINRHVKRVRCRKVFFEVLGDGRVQMNLRLEKR